MTTEALTPTYVIDPAYDYGAAARRVVADEWLTELGLTLSDEFMTALLPNPREKIVTGGWQAGKALDLDTRVKTADGHEIPMGAIRAGEQLLDEHGGPTTVLGTSPIWLDRKCYRVRFDDYTYAIADAAHEWSVFRKRAQRRNPTGDPEEWTSRSTYTTAALRQLNPPFDLPGGRKIIGIEDNETAPTMCIEVDSPEHTFQLANGAVTHNSTEGAAEVWLDLVTMPPGYDFLGWLVVTSYQAPHKELDYLMEWAEKAGFLSRAHIAAPEASQASWIELRMQNGSRALIQTKTARDVGAIAGEPCDIVLLCESGAMPESIFSQARGRVVTRRGRIVATGTIEDDDARPRFAWYAETAQEWRQHPIYGERFSINLPTWSNLAIYKQGYDDPEIQRLLRIEGEWTFKQKYGGIPEGSQDPVYPILQEVDYNSADPTACRFHYDCSDVTLPWAWGFGAGGHDFGEGEFASDRRGHPSTLGVVTLLPWKTPAGLAVVRDAYSERTHDLESRRMLMGERYHIPSDRWAFDPMQREAAALLEVEVAGNNRNRRAGYFNKRLRDDTIRFDLTKPHVIRGFEQMRRVKRIKRFVAGRGAMWVYSRDDDDYAAAFENAIELIHTKQVRDGAPRSIDPRRLLNV